MFRNAVQRHEKENASAKPASQSLFNSSPPTEQAYNSSQSNNPGYRNPLKPASASTLNGSRGWQQPRTSTGMKRTASGLAKACDGAFDDGPGSRQQPISIGGASRQKGLVQVMQNDFVDENDFDSDIDLDVEEPLPKKTAPAYPSLPQQDRSASPSKPSFYPTLPRQQQAPRNASRDLDSGYGSVEANTMKNVPASSAPLPWSSSPVEHFEAAKPFSGKPFMYKPGAQSAQNGPPPPQAQPKPTKRRTLPWLEKEEEESAQVAPAGTSKTKSGTDFTPLPKDNKKAMYPWNTTASAVKEQQKKHREESKRAMKKNEPDEDTLRKAKSTQQRPARVFLSEEQQHVLGLVLEKKKSVFFTGSAGTGKSVLMREIISALRKNYSREPDRVAVTASTGLAACNVGGVTLHSFAGIGLGKEDVPELVRKIKRNQKAKHRWMRTKVLVVDEVSMVDGELFDKLEAIARQLRNNGRPFGGIQLVVTGDFFQLPPVPDSGRAARFAFDAGTWKTTIEHTIALHHVFRQKDPIFAGMLNEMREGRLQPSSIAAFSKLNRPLTFEDDITATELFPTRKEVDEANASKMRNLQGKDYVFDSRDGGAIVDQAQRDKLLQNCMAPAAITLKKGAQVMLIKNIDESLVNGSLGRVIGFMDERKFDSYTNNEEDYASNPDGTLASTMEAELNAAEATKKRLVDSITTARQWPVVRFMITDGTTRDLLCQPESWKVELPNGEVQASRNQIPLILAWALSIHKAQGQTLERVKVDLGRVFEKGQAYVALSRATAMKGLQVMRFDAKKVVAHERVRTFYANLSRFELAEKNAERTKGLDEGKKKGAMAADDYERDFVDGEW